MVYSSESYKFSETLHECYPEAEERLSRGHKYDLRSNVFDSLGYIFDECETTKGHKKIAVLGRQNNSRRRRMIREDFLEDHENLHRYKVIVSRANGEGLFGEKLSNPFVGMPEECHTQTFISMGAFATKREAENLLIYIKTKFSRAMLGIMKKTQNNPKYVWQFVPMQDFTDQSDIDWSRSVEEIDRQLYAKYKLSPEEIEFIETNVQAMV